MFGVVPKPLWEKRAPADERNRITLAMRPLLVRRRRHDDAHRRRHRRQDGREERRDLRASTGTTQSRSTRWRAAGLPRRRHRRRASRRTCTSITPAASRRAATAGAVVPPFPERALRRQRGEWEDATHPARAQSRQLSRGELRAAAGGRRRRFHRRRRRGRCPGISVRRTGGHTLHHQLVTIESGGRTAVFTADLMPTTAHVDEPWIMGYDLYPMDTLAFKTRVRARGHRARVRYLLRARSRRSPPATSGRTATQDRRACVEPV